MNKIPHKKGKVKKMRKIIHRIWRNTVINDVYSYMTKNKHPNSYKVKNCRGQQVDSGQAEEHEQHSCMTWQPFPCLGIVTFLLI